MVINADVVNPAGIADSLTENLQLTAVLEVYDNEDILQQSYSWDQDDLLQLLEEELDELSLYRATPSLRGGCVLCTDRESGEMKNRTIFPEYQPLIT